MAEYVVCGFARSGVILGDLIEQPDRFGWKDDAQRREILRWLLPGHPIPVKAA